MLLKKCGELNGEEIKQAKKIFVRCLKDLGIYSNFINGFHKIYHCSLEYHLSHNCADRALLVQQVDTIWQLIRISNVGKALSSIFLILLYSNEEFNNIFIRQITPEQYNYLVHGIMSNEMSYLSGLAYDELNDIQPYQIIMLAEPLARYHKYGDVNIDVCVSKLANKTISFEAFREEYYKMKSEYDSKNVERPK